MNKWTQAFEWNRPSIGPGKPAPWKPAPVAANQYFAFLSYSHNDSVVADWLHGQLERFRVPASLVGRLTATGVVPRRLTPVFRDRHELAASGDLAAEIREALEGSHCLIVLCSPAAAASKWTNAEIELFRRLHPDGCIIAAIISGEPFASEVKGQEAEECLPPALRRKYDRRGRPTAKRAEPLAADLRDVGDGRRLGFLKIVAGMLGVGLDELVQRDQLRRQRRLATITGLSLLGMVAALLLAVTAIEARDAARDQRREAEGLVAFMLGDLKDKLEPIGKLDALDGVGQRVLAYYSKQDMSELSDAGLLQRSRALSLSAEVAFLRDDVQTARRLYGEAVEGTAEAISRDPTDPQRIFDHSQNVFWIAQIEWQLGRVAQAEAGLRDYKRLADQLVELEPNSMSWRMEQQSADFNLGILLFARRKFSEAIDQFTRSLATMQALATADPGNSDYQVAVTESQIWLADARSAIGQLGAALRIREQVVARLQRHFKSTGNVAFQQQLVPAERSLGELYLMLGKPPDALAHFRAAVSNAGDLIAREPTSSRWKAFSARASLSLADALLISGNQAEATNATDSGCNIVAQLLADQPGSAALRARMSECWEMRARLSLADGNTGRAKQFAERAVETARSVHSTDPIDDRHALASALRLLGDIRSRSGDAEGARAAWSAALAAMPANVAEKPDEMAERATILERLRKLDQSQPIWRALESIGFEQSQV